MKLENIKVGTLYRARHCLAGNIGIVKIHKIEGYVYPVIVKMVLPCNNIQISPKFFIGEYIQLLPDEIVKEL